MNQKHVANHITKLCKKHKEETRIVNVLFDIMKLLENKNINVIYDKIVINKNRASLYIDELKQTGSSFTAQGMVP